MSKRLGERESLLVRRSQDGEQLPADRVRIALAVADRVERRGETAVVVGEDLIDAARQVVEGLAVRGKHARHRERAYRPQRVQEVAERVVAGERVQPDIRRNPR